METAETFFTPKNAKFRCYLCDFKCFKNADWSRHVMTKKHIYRLNGNDLENAGNLFPKNAEKNAEYICDCGRYYSTKSGMWKHKQKCNKKTPKRETSKKLIELDKDELIITLLKQNAELIKGQKDMMKGQQDMIIKLTENGITNNTNSNNTNNSHNKAFNLNFFLNETCKNAMNITDFIDSIKLQLSDFINIGETGFVEGISNIIVKNLNSLDETIRPIHCTDQKRETFYVKDQDKWEKEEEDRKKINKMIRSISYKNEKLMNTYKEKYPDYNDSESSHSDHYSKLVIEAMDCKEESREKIIKNISKATTIKNK